MGLLKGPQLRMTSRAPFVSQLPDPSGKTPLSSDFHLGVLAPEYPPQIGGMPTLARDLAAALSDSVRVSVFTKRGLGSEELVSPEPTFLTANLLADSRALNDAEVDAWLALNAGLIPMARFLRAPYFAYVHGNDFLRPWIPCGPGWFERVRRPYAAKLRHSLRRRAIHRAIDLPRLVFCNSTRTAELLRMDAEVAADKIRVSPPGVNEAFFTVRKGQPSMTLRILTVAKLSQTVARKNVDGVIRAVALLGPSVDISYTVVGDGDDRHRLEELTVELGLQGRIRFAGRVEERELLACYSEADLFILASKASPGDVEGFGIVYIEASAAGVPVICSREGGATDAVSEGVNGLLIPDSSPESIAAGIKTYCQQRSSFDEAEIRAWARQFRWNAIAPRLLEELASAL